MENQKINIEMDVTEWLFILSSLNTLKKYLSDENLEKAIEIAAKIEAELLQ